MKFFRADCAPPQIREKTGTTRADEFCTIAGGGWLVAAQSGLKIVGEDLLVATIRWSDLQTAHFDGGKSELTLTFVGKAQADLVFLIVEADPQRFMDQVRRGVEGACYFVAHTKTSSGKDVTAQVRTDCGGSFYVVITPDIELVGQVGEEIKTWLVRMLDAAGIEGVKLPEIG